MRTFRTVVAMLALAMLAGCGDRPAEPDSSIGFESVSDDPVAHGRRVAQVLGCSGCHGADLTGRDWSDELGVLWTSNLTQVAHRYTDDQLRAAIQGGVNPSRDLWGMPSHLFTQLADQDMAALIAYLRSVPPTGAAHPEPTFGAELRQAIARDELRSSRADVVRDGRAWPVDLGPKHAFARYAVRATCAECHGMDLSGAQPPFGGKPRPDLNVAAAYSLEDFRVLMRTGKAVGGRELELMSEIARGRYSAFTDDEIDAIHTYLSARALAMPAQ